MLTTEGGIARTLAASLVSQGGRVGLCQAGRLVGGGAGIVGGGRQALVHGISESLAGWVRMDGAAAW